eukprot:1834633-Pyramimonas_sp.AAC.1
MASTQEIPHKLARVSVLISHGGSVPDVARHRDASIRPVIDMGAISWVDLRAPGGASTFPILYSLNRHFESKS